MKSALIVMVHGSPRPEANDDMHRVVDIVRTRNIFDIVEVGFMECNEPTIMQAIENAVGTGVDKLVAVPYFLHTGKHVADDLPTILDEARGRYPSVEFAMGRYVGGSEWITAILLDRAVGA